MENLEDFFKFNITNFEYLSKNENETIEFGLNIAKYLKTKDIIVLNGELGSGKTVLMKGIASFFGLKNEVASPTFTIVNEYNAKDLNIFHFDVYRLKDSVQFTETIGTDYFENGLCIIEWGHIIEDILPKNTIYINITKKDVDTRLIEIRRK